MVSLATRPVLLLVARTLAEAMDRAEHHAEPLLLLEHADVRFGDVRALQRISLALRRGDRLALVGANGSGKTTLLRLLHGLVPFEGRRDVVAINGRMPVIAMLLARLRDAPDGASTPPANVTAAPAIAGLLASSIVPARS